LRPEVQPDETRAADFAQDVVLESAVLRRPIARASCPVGIALRIAAHHQMVDGIVFGGDDGRHVRPVLEQLVILKHQRVKVRTIVRPYAAKDDEPMTALDRADRIELDAAKIADDLQNSVGSRGQPRGIEVLTGEHESARGSKSDGEKHTSRSTLWRFFSERFHRAANLLAQHVHAFRQPALQIIARAAFFPSLRGLSQLFARGLGALTLLARFAALHRAIDLLAHIPYGLRDLLFNLFGLGMLAGRFDQFFQLLTHLA
jgi:hypothetical protein